jgi:hypothetical protein
LDEAHYGNKDENTVLEGFIQKNLMSQNSDKILMEHDNFLLCVTATPFLMNLKDKYNKKLKIPILETPNFWGAAKYLDAEKVFDGPVIDKHGEWILAYKKIVEKETARLDDPRLKDHTMIFRVPKGGALIKGKDGLRWPVVLPERHIAETIYEVKIFDQDSAESLESIVNFIGTSYKKKKVIIIVDNMRAGVNFNSFEVTKQTPRNLKAMISCVVDPVSYSSGPSSVLQSLFGRMNGYFQNTPDVHIYTNKLVIEEYADLIAGDFIPHEDDEENEDSNDRKYPWNAIDRMNHPDRYELVHNFFLTRTWNPNKEYKHAELVRKACKHYKLTIDELETLEALPKNTSRIEYLSRYVEDFKTTFYRPEGWLWEPRFTYLRRKSSSAPSVVKKHLHSMSHVSIGSFSVCLDYNNHSIKITGGVGTMHSTIKKLKSEPKAPHLDTNIHV